MNYILAAILSNLSYAVADNVNGLFSKKNSPLKNAFWVTVFGMLLFFIPAVTVFRGELANVTSTALLIVLAINLLVNIGYLSFITGMTKAGVTLTGVIGGSFPAATTIVALLIFGETISASQGLAIVIILLGVALSSMQGKATHLLRDIRKSGTIYAFGAFFFWGIYFALIRIPVEQIGWFLPQYTSNVVGFLLFLLIAWRTKNRNVVTKPALIWLLALATILQTTGSLFFNYAISQGQTAVVAPIAGSSPAVFVILAYFIFKEKLNRKQWVGIVLALFGIISLSISSS